jgi:hypothetical protein
VESQARKWPKKAEKNSERNRICSKEKRRRVDLRRRMQAVGQMEAA